jgi:hypothetical protein
VRRVVSAVAGLSSYGCGCNDDDDDGDNGNDDDAALGGLECHIAVRGACITAPMEQEQ